MKNMVKYDKIFYIKRTLLLTYIRFFIYYFIYVWTKGENEYVQYWRINHKNRKS